MTDEPEDWLDEQLLLEDSSERNWARRALGNKSVNECLMCIPKNGQILMINPIEPHRVIQDHIKSTGLTQSKWIRRAVAMAMAVEDGDEATIEKLL